MKFPTPVLGRDIDYDRVYEPAGIPKLYCLFDDHIKRGFVFDAGCIGERCRVVKKVET